MTEKELRALLWAAAQPRQKLVASEALPDWKLADAVAQLPKTVGPNADVGTTVLRQVASILTFGDREILRVGFDRVLRPGVDSLLREIEHHEQVQLDLFESQVRTIETMRELRDRLEEAVQRAPFEKKRA